MTKNVIPAKETDVILAKAGIHFGARQKPMDSRFRGNDEITDPRRRMNSLTR
jgi:hypothetical protein